MTLMNYRPLGAEPEDSRLGRFIPDDDQHIKKYPFSRYLSMGTISTVEETLALPRWHWTHNQGYEGSCVGHAVAMERAIINTEQNRVLRIFRGGQRYDPIHVWNEAKRIDQWEDTNPGDDNGTSVRAAYDVARDQGLRRIKYGGVALDSRNNVIVTDRTNTPDPAHGVQRNRWAVNVDEMRTAIALGIPVVIGVNWYANFDRPREAQYGKRFGRIAYVVGVGDLGRIRGGHAVCVYGASDKRQAFKFKNSWGRNYPLCWLPYGVMERLLAEWGEAALVTDR